MRRGRAPVLVVLALLLVAGGLADRAGRDAPGVDATPVLGPRAPAASATSSTWFCTGAHARLDGQAVGTVVVANLAASELTGTVTVVPDDGTPREVAIRVPAPGRVSVRLADVLTADNASALVELNGGAAVAEMVTIGPQGDSVTPCASSSSDTWYFAEGATTIDATEVLMVFNPFPEDALVDMSFATETGHVVPQGLTGLVVEGRGMRAIAVGDAVRREAVVSTTVTSRVGRLVVARLQLFDGTGSIPRRGVALTLGAPATSPSWYFPEGYVSDGVTERIQVYNPTTRESRIEIDVLLDQGEADPVELTIPPRNRVSFVANDEPRIPKNLGHAAIVRTVNGVDVVAERTVEALPPSSLTGLSITLGATQPAQRWALAAGEPDVMVAEYVTVLNPGGAAANVTITALPDGERVVPPQLRRLRVAARGRAVIRVGDYVTRPVPALEVRATGAVVVERDLYRTTAAGRAMAMGIPA
jgi:hypothetical protein